MIISDDFIFQWTRVDRLALVQPLTSRNHSTLPTFNDQIQGCWVGKSTTFQEKVICEKCQNTSIYLTSWRKCIQLMYIQLCLYQRVIRMNQSNIMSISAIRKKLVKPTNLQQKLCPRNTDFKVAMVPWSHLRWSTCRRLVVIKAPSCIAKGLLLVRPWKWMVGRWNVLLGPGLFLGAMLNFQGV